MNGPTSAGTVAVGVSWIHIAAIIGTAIAFWVGAGAARKAVQRLAAHGGLETSMARLFGQTVWIGLIAVGAITVLDTLGIKIGALVAGLGLTGLVVGLALNQILSNALAGIMVIIYKPFRENDHIAVTTFAGRVSEINLRYTTLAAGEKRICIPNAMVLSNVVVVDAKPSAPSLPPPPPAAPSMGSELR